MIKKGDIQIGDFYYCVRSLGLLPYNINESLKVDKYVCTDINEMPNGHIFISCILQHGDSTHHIGQRGDFCFKTIEGVHEAIEKHKASVIRKKKSDLEKIQNDLNAFEQSGFNVEIIILPFLETAKRLTKEEID